MTLMALAVALDLLFGDPPNRFHPVAWIGTILIAARRRLPKRGRLIPLLCGAGLMMAGVVAAVVVGRSIESGLACLPRPIAVAVGAVALKSLFSIRGLVSAAQSVAGALAIGNLDEARRLASWHLVGRPTGGLDAPRVAAAAIESVAENASDGVVGPLLFYAVGGLAGALAYRVINTADSVLGHRTTELEWLGKVPARLDDLANLAPARLTAAMTILAAPVVGGTWSGAARVWWRDLGSTASPNAGHPMSAAAGALGVELEKVERYRLGAGLRLPEAADIGRSIRLMRVALALSAIPIGLLRLAVGSRFGV